MLESFIGNYAVDKGYQHESLNKGTMIPHMSLVNKKSLKLIFKDFRSLQAQDASLDQTIATWVPRCLLCANIRKQDYNFRCSSEIGDVSKISFPHGISNTVEGLINLTSCPLDDGSWYNILKGTTPEMSVREMTRDRFQEDRYKNLYRCLEKRFIITYFKPFFIHSLLCGVYVKRDVAGAYSALMRFREEILFWTGLGNIYPIFYFTLYCIQTLFKRGNSR